MRIRLLLPGALLTVALLIILGGWLGGGPSAARGQTLNPAAPPPPQVVTTRGPAKPVAVAATDTPTPIRTPAAGSAANPPPATPCPVDYTFSQATGATIVPGTTDINNHCDNCNTTISLPFAFQLYNQLFTSANVSANGVLDFMSNTPSSYNTCLPNSGYDYAIFPYWADLDTTNSAACSTCGIFTAVSGTAPNRIFIIEWRAVYHGTPTVVNFEALLAENQPQFQFVYGTVPGGTAAETVGVQRDHGSHSTQFSCNTAGLSAGLQLTFTLPPPCAPPPTPTPITCATNGDYAFGQTANATIVPGTTDINNHCDNCNTTISLPFAYQLYNQLFTSANVSANGALDFMSNTPSSYSTCLPSSSYDYAIFPYWQDLRTTTQGEGIFTSVSGSAPSRIFNIEWRAEYVSTGLPVNFELRLYEGQTRFDVIYGIGSDAGRHATVGVQRDHGSHTTQFICSLDALYPGLQVSFTLPPPCALSPTPTPVLCSTSGDYAFSQSANATIVPGTTDINNHCDNCNTTISLPFAYQLYNQLFTSANISANGALDFVSNTPSSYSTCLPNVSYDYAIFPYWQDLSTATQGEGIFTSVSGSTPSRIFNIEWRAEYVSTGLPVNFELRLYEGQPRFDVIYGIGSDAGRHATVGVQRDHGSHSTQFICNLDRLYPGLQVTFALPPACPTPTPVLCGATTNDYAVSQAAGATLVPGTTDINNHCENCTTNVSLPFAYTLYDQAFSAVNVGANGTLEFVSNSGSLYNSCLPNTGFNYAVFPYWQDLRTTNAGEGIFTSISGSAPTRIFNIEWRAEYAGGSGAGLPLNFEVRLYEGQSRFDVVYGLVPDGGRHATVGVQRATGNLSTQFACSLDRLYPGLQLTFQLGLCGAPTGTPPPVAAPAVTGPGDQQAPRIDHHLMVYEDNSTGDWDVLAKDVASPGATPFPVYRGPGDQRVPAISGDLVVWQDNRNGTWDIYGRRLSGGAEFPIFAGPGDQTNPRVKGNLVVWENTLTPGHTSIVAEDLPSGQPVTLSDPATTNAAPDLDSTLVVWQSTVPTLTLKLPTTGAGWQIVGYDLGRSLPLTLTTGAGDHTNPAVYSTTVIWVTTLNPTAAGPLYHGDSTIDGVEVRGTASPTPIAVTTAQAGHRVTQPRVQGRQVAYVDELVAADGAIMATNLDTHTAATIAPHGHNSRDPDVDSDGNLVWRQTSSSGDADIYSTFCQPATFSDVHTSDYFYTPVQWLTCAGAISGYGDGTFRPYADTTRGQLAKIIVGAEGWAVNTSGGPHFGDVPVSNPFYPFVETAYNRGVINGYADGTFRPFANVTRGQLAKIVVGAQGWAPNTTGGPHFSDVAVANPFYISIETAFNHGVISGYGDGTFRWGNNATRGQISKIVYNAVTAP